MNDARTNGTEVSEALAAVRVNELTPGSVFDRALVDVQGRVVLEAGRVLSVELRDELSRHAGGVFAARAEAEAEEEREAETPRRVIWEMERQASLHRGEIRRTAERVVSERLERWHRLEKRVGTIGGGGGAGAGVSSGALGHAQAAIGEAAMQSREAMWINDLSRVLDTGEGSAPGICALAEEAVELATRRPQALLLDALSPSEHGAGSVEQLAGHALRVGMLSALVAVRLGWSDDDAGSAALAGMFSDSGMLLVALNVREKARGLTDEEFNQVRRHPAYSAAIVERVREYAGSETISECVSLGVFQHHERENARGYPNLSAARAIHDVAKVVGACDVLMGMISARAHRPGLDPAAGVREVVHGAARGELNGRVVRALVDVCGVYPPGSKVRLSTGEPGLVIGRGMQRDGLRPVVRIIKARVGGTGAVVDLSRSEAGGVRVLGPLAA